MRPNGSFDCELTTIMNVSAAERSCGGQTANIYKDITADQSGSTQAGGLITERDAGKQTPTTEV